MSKVVVIGASHHNTLGVVRSLGEAGIELEAFIYTDNASREYVSKSHYISSFHIFDQCDKNIIDTLLECFCKEQEKIILIPTSDAALTLLEQYIDSLENFIIPNCLSDKFSVSECLSKKRMNEIAEQYGFLVPWSMVLLPRKTFNEAEICFPCIVKPLESAKGDKRDIVICYHNEDLVECLKKYADNEIPALIQQYVEPEKEIGVMGVCFDGMRECRLPDIIVKKRFSNKSATYAEIHPIEEYKDFEETEQNIRNMIFGIGYSGVFDMDYIYSKGKYYFIEMNLRNGAYGYGFTKIGINFLGDWCKYQISGQLPEKYNIRNTSVMSEFSDFKAARSQRVSFFTWISQFIRSAHLIIQLKDVRPTLTYIWSKISR